MHVCNIKTRVFYTAVFIKSKKTSLSSIEHLTIFCSLGVGLIFVVVIGLGTGGTGFDYIMGEMKNRARGVLISFCPLQLFLHDFFCREL